MTYGEYAVWLAEHAARAAGREWETVMLFYAAVHATNQILYPASDAPRHHTQHEHALLNHPTLGTFYMEYEALRALSEDARYRPRVHPFGPERIAHARKMATVILRASGIDTELGPADGTQGSRVVR